MMNLNGELRDRFAAVWNVFFSLKLQYQGEPLVYAALDGKELAV